MWYFHDLPNHQAVFTLEVSTREADRLALLTAPSIGWVNQD